MLRWRKHVIVCMCLDFISLASWHARQFSLQQILQVYPNNKEFFWQYKSFRWLSLINIMWLIDLLSHYIFVSWQVGISFLNSVILKISKCKSYKFVSTCFRIIITFEGTLPPWERLLGCILKGFTLVEQRDMLREIQYFMYLHFLSA